MNLEPLGANKTQLTIEKDGNRTEILFSYQTPVAARRFGVCRLRAGQTPRITISTALTELNTEEEFINTVLHEIAHALTPRARHGYEWRAVALAIGCDGKRCYGNEIVKPAAKFTGTCPACHRVIERFKRTAIACGQCCRANGGGFQAQFKFVWKRGA